MEDCVIHPSWHSYAACHSHPEYDPHAATGLLSRTRPKVDTAKVQDVMVRQRFGQRLVGVVDLALDEIIASSKCVMR